MRSSQSVEKISPALVRAINSIEGVKKASTNPHFKSRYANLESVIETAHEALSENGLAVMQGPGPLDGTALTLTTRLIHESGEWIETDFSLPMARADPQAAGSALTYARRYSLMAMLNMPAVDDDGNEANVSKRVTAGQIAAIAASTSFEYRDTGPSEVDGKDWWGAEGSGITAHAAKKAGWEDLHEQMRSQIDQLTTAQSWKTWCAENAHDIKPMPRAWRMILRAEAEEKGVFLGAIVQN